MDKSYSYQNTPRDLSVVLDTIVAADPSLISIVGRNGLAHNTKHEWLQDKLSPETDALAAAVAANDATSLTVVNGAAFSAGMVIAFEGYDEVMRVSAVSTNTLTVSRGYGGTTALAAIANGTEIKIISRPRAEGTSAGDDPGRQPTSDYNYTEIFDYTASLSKTANAVGSLGIDNLLDYQVANGSRMITRRMNNALIYGRRVERSANADGSMGGILQFVGGTTGVAVDGNAADLTAAMVNGAIESIVRRGGRPNTILCNTNQARKISGFNNNLQVQRADQTTGNAVYQFLNDLPMGVISRIVVDINFPKKKLAILDSTRIDLIPLKGRALNDVDATPAGADYVARRLLGEYTAEIKNGDSAHGMINNLKL
ncbi:Phage protein [Gammaproteobacteria bacterium]